MKTKIQIGGLVILALLAVQVPAKGQGPVVIATDPPTNTTVRALTFIDIFFENSVTGVDASDLLIEGWFTRHTTSMAATRAAAGTSHCMSHGGSPKPDGTRAGAGRGLCESGLAALSFVMKFSGGRAGRTRRNSSSKRWSSVSFKQEPPS